MRRVVSLVLALCLGASAVRAQGLPRGRDPQALARAFRGAPRRWTAIVVHHSAGPAGSAATLDAYHRRVRRMPRGLAYHFVIGNGRGLGDGEIEAGPRWTRQQPGAHVASSLRDPATRDLWDEVGIGVCLVGDFERAPPTRAQRAALRGLVAALRRRFRIPAARVLGHGEVPGARTACPGRALARALRGARVVH